MGDNELLYDPQRILKRARQRMPSLEAEMVPNAYHLTAMARPDEVNVRIIRFLAPAAALRDDVGGI
jgi:pimeloyl-ACP methyl ester carboxylesterase